MDISKRNIITGIGVLMLVVGVILFVPKQTANPGDVVMNEVETSAQSAPTPAIPSASRTTVASNASAPVSQTGKLYKDFVRPTGFANTTWLRLLNTEEFTLKQFIGEKVILLNFWTTSSSNSLRMFPYLNAWHTKYKDKGLLVVSIHVPRFAFEQSKSNVDKTFFAHNVLHPIVLDNNYETWKAYGNSVWPHQYLININGYISYDHAGEGAYEKTELKIQELLALRAQKLGLSKETYAPPAMPKEAVVVDLAQVKSPETYFGSARNSTLGNGVRLKDGTQDLEYPAKLNPNTPYLSGGWNFTKEYVSNLVANTSVYYEYNAKRVHAVLDAQKSIRIKVLRDSLPLTTDNAGKDILFEKGESYFYVSGARIYDIVNDQTGYGSHKLELIIQDSGFQMYTIAFG